MEVKPWPCSVTRGFLDNKAAHWMLCPNSTIWEVCSLHNIYILTGISTLCDAQGADEYLVMLQFEIWDLEAQVLCSKLCPDLVFITLAELIFPCLSPL